MFQFDSASLLIGSTDTVSNRTTSKPLAHTFGQRQSPVDISPEIVKFDRTLGDGQFNFNYHPYDCQEIVNKGTTWAIKIKSDCISTLSAIHLPGIFKLVDVHGHWGIDPSCGSEHLIAGTAYSAEIHLVHMNTKYRKIEDAKTHADGLAVLGILIEESNEDNPALESLMENIKKVPYKNDTLYLHRGFNVKHLIPDNKEFWTYEGSLTTPPFCECVIWTVFRSTVKASNRQLDSFRQIYSVGQDEIENEDCHKVVNNFRHPQPLHDRHIRASFFNF